MPVGVEAFGTLSYNGFAFDGTSKVSVQIELVKDDAQRTVIYHRNTIRVSATVAGWVDGQMVTTDSKMQDIRTALGEPARQLRFTGRGFGNDLIVGGVGGALDVLGGPYPEMLTWEPIGASNACQIEWQCVVCVAVCDSPGARRTSGIMAMSYEQDFSIDEHGDTTRVTTGYLQIVQGRNGRRPADTADAYLNRIQVTQPIGFQRTQSRHLSHDKARLDFVITDTQIPSNNPYPPLVSAISGKHRVRWSRTNSGAMTLRNTISLDISPKAGVSGSQAWQIFGDIVSQRLKIAKDGGRVVLLDEIDVEEDLFGRGCSFSAGYRVLSSLEDLLKASGLWSPLGTTWAAWHQSMADVFGSRGTMGMEHSVANDLIVDLCGGDPTITIDQLTYPKTYQPPQRLKLKNEKPPAEKSYLQYNMTVAPYRVRPVVRQSVAQPPDQPQYSFQMPDQSVDFTYPATIGTPDIIQEGGPSRYSIHLIGSGVRAGYPIPRPSLREAGSGGAAPVEHNCQFLQANVGDWLGVPIYRAQWNVSYSLPSSPQVVKPEINYKEIVSARP